MTMLYQNSFDVNDAADPSISTAQCTWGGGYYTIGNLANGQMQLTDSALPLPDIWIEVDIRANAVWGGGGGPKLIIDLVCTPSSFFVEWLPGFSLINFNGAYIDPPGATTGTSIGDYTVRCEFSGGNVSFWVDGVPQGSQPFTTPSQDGIMVHMQDGYGLGPDSIRVKEIRAGTIADYSPISPAFWTANVATTEVLT